MPSLEAVGVITVQAEPSLRSPDIEREASILRRLPSADVDREDGARASLPENADVIGRFASALLAGVRQFDNGPQNLGPSIDLDDRSEDRFHQVERMSSRDGQQVGAGRGLV